MTEPLPNRDEPLPEKRYYDPSTEDNWADILHDVLEEISVNSLVSGSDHTQFEPVEGQLFVPTDGGAWYLGDGESWNEVATSGGGGASIGGTHSATGDGSTRSFEWSTGITDPADLEYATVDANSEAASTDFRTFINGTNIGVEYAAAPADGDALSWFWSVNATVSDVDHQHEDDDLLPRSVTAGSIDTDELNNVFVARPGDLQATIDDAAAVSGPATVQLVPNENYSVTGIEVKGSVTLDFNGAEVVPDTDADMFIMHPNARVLNPHVDVTGLSSYTSAVWVFDASIVGSFTGFDHYTGIFGGITRGNPGEGTGVYFHNASDGFIHWVRIAHNFSRFDTAIDMFSESGGGHINANQFQGYIGRAVRGVHTRGSAALDGNTFHLETQASGSGVAAWVHENGSRNVWRGQAWDPSSNSNGAWWIKSGAGSQNAFYDPQIITVKDHITDDVGDDTNVARTPGRFVGEAKLISSSQPSIDSNRSFGTWYQNNSGYEIYITVVVSNSGGDMNMRLNVNDSESTRVLDQHVAPGASGEEHIASLSGHVPVGSYFQVQEYAGGSIKRWTEHKIGGS